MFTPPARNSKRAGLAALGTVSIATLLLVLLAAPVSWATASSRLVTARDTVPAGAGLGAVTFKSACVVCHGKLGKGDGPVAVAMHPPPANLTDTARLLGFSDDSLVQVITHGRRGMPSFKDDLSSEQIRQVVAYIRTLQP